MDSKKVVIIVMILILVIFIVFVIGGSLSGDQPKNWNKNDAMKEAANIQPPAGSEAFRKLFGGLQESVILCDPSSNSNTGRKCEKLPQGSLNIPRAKDPYLPFLKKTTFRTVRLELIKGEATVVYSEVNGGSKIDNPQVLFNRPSSKKIESIVISESGGTLTISCKQNSPGCQVGQL